ncbi:hypothetical protein [Salinibacter sp. 10B]|uniref:hypothetical protein n=1 Tax=Salinibacter sp. 10B TaxID=1923971 RepID=UPI0011B07B52|nr:hypothetical protein [Salinibacter sp. 10B]
MEIPDWTSPDWLEDAFSEKALSDRAADDAPDDEPADGSAKKGSDPNDREAQEKESKSYLITEIRGNHKQRDLLNQAVEEAPEPIRSPYRHFIIHLITCAKIYGVREYHPIHHQTLIDKLPEGWRLTEIEGGTSRLWRFDESVIQCLDGGKYASGDDHRHGRAREYRIDPDFALDFHSAGSGANPNYNLHHANKRVWSSAAMKTILTTPSGHRWGKKCSLPGGHYSLIDGALRNLDEADHRIRTFPIYRVRDVAEAGYRRAAENHPADHPKLLRAKGRYHSILSSLGIIKRQSRHVENGVASLTNAYEVQPISGRFSFRRGGPQSLPGALKAFAYDFEDVYNYDIKSSQTVALRQLASDLRSLGYDVDTKPLDEYIERGGKDWVVENEDYDLPRGLVKQVEHAVKFGGRIPASMEQAYYCKYKSPWGMPKIAEHVEDHFDDREEQNQALEDLAEVFGPQVEMIEELADGLLGAYWSANSTPGGRGKGRVVHNQCGITFCKFDYEEGHERRSKAMAWYLQGLEAAYVHAITILAEQYSYEVMANEHDGCITTGQVPNKAKERARTLSGFEKAELKRKPFAGEEDVRTICKKCDLKVPSRLKRQSSGSTGQSSYRKGRGANRDERAQTTHGRRAPAESEGLRKAADRAAGAS